MINTIIEGQRAAALVWQREREKEVVVFHATDSDNPIDINLRLAEAFAKEINRQYPQSRLAIGLGQPAKDVSAWRSSYRDAVQARDLAIRLQTDTPLYIGDLGVYQLILSLNDREKLSSFCQHTLGSLIEYDDRHNADLLKTLEAFFTCHGNLANVASIATNKDGSEVVVIYGGTQFGNGLYFTSSSDDGNSWSEPYPIYLTGDESIIVTDPELFAGESGKVHAVWSTFLDDGSAGPGLYTHYDPQSRAWIEPAELDVPGIRTPSVIEKDGEVFVGYYHANGNHNWWRKSGDYGVTWSLPRQMSSLHRGTNGRISFAVDGENTLHAFFGQRIDDNNHGMWHKIYSGSTFSNLEAVVRGRQIRDRVGGKGFDPRAAS